MTASLLSLPVYAVEPAGAQKVASVIRSEDTVGKTIGDYRLVDQDGREFKTSDFLGKPLVVSFIYASCAHICPTISMSMSRVLGEKEGRLGKDFRFLTVSFDPDRDKPAKLKEYGSHFTKDFENWRYASSDMDTIERMTRDFGFYYKQDGPEYQHINMISVVGADGKILTHVYGIDFKPDLVIDPIYFPDSFKKSNRTGISLLMEKVVLFCYDYDPETNTYRLDWANIAGLILQGVMLFTIMFFVWKKEIMDFLTRLRGGKASSETEKT